MIFNRPGISRLHPRRSKRLCSSIVNGRLAGLLACAHETPPARHRDSLLLPCLSEESCCLLPGKTCFKFFLRQSFEAKMEGGLSTPKVASERKQPHARHVAVAVFKSEGRCHRRESDSFSFNCFDLLFCCVADGTPSRGCSLWGRRFAWLVVYSS